MDPLELADAQIRVMFRDFHRWINNLPMPEPEALSTEIPF
jgi:hypothetical protein